jgi:hypothetical protein
MTDKKQQLRAINCREDLDSLVAGDVVVISASPKKRIENSSKKLFVYFGKFDEGLGFVGYDGKSGGGIRAIVEKNILYKNDGTIQLFYDEDNSSIIHFNEGFYDMFKSMINKAGL